MSTREQFLDRVRKALGRDASGSSTEGQSLPGDLGRVLPPIPPASLVDHFEAEFRAVGGTPHRVDSASGLGQVLGEILPQGSAVVLSRNSILARADITETLDSLNCALTRWPATSENSGGPAFARQCFAAAAGMTGVDFVLAESGTLVLASATEGSQLVSLAPPIHIAFYRQEQVVESLEEVLTGLATLHARPSEPEKTSIERADLEGRSMVMITGSSRTADIEQISIRGVHGPTQVHAILLA
ncbi:MAG TPA: lactate utilization protein [Terriglobia bacterium]|nr:lactate utilization protein [Terriglobia bacterium]